MDPSARAALFDATGTLIELREPVGETYSRFARARGIEIAPRHLEAAFARALADAPPMVFPGLSVHECASRERDAWHEIVRATFLAAAPRSAPSADACFDPLFAHFSGARAWRARPGAHSALRALRASGVATGVVSNFDRRLHAILGELELVTWLDLVWLPSDAGVAKPDPGIFLGALGALGVAPDRALFVGNDAVRDLAGARRAGLHAVDVGTLATLAQLPERLEREIPEELPR